MKRFLSISFICAVLSFPLVASATMVMPLNLERMNQYADRIFLGSVVEVDDAFDESGRWCQYITFDVKEVYKGDIGKTLRIKQMNPKPAKAENGVVVTSTLFRGIPQYQEGEEVVVFLNGDSAIGFTSPVGLGQGRFRVKTGAAGQKLLLNDYQNAGLFKNMKNQSSFQIQGVTTKAFQSLTQEPRDLELNQLKSLIKALDAKKAGESSHE